MQSAIIVYNSADFFKYFGKFPPETWLVWVDKGGVNNEV